MKIARRSLYNAFSDDPTRDKSRARIQDFLGVHIWSETRPPNASIPGKRPGGKSISPKKAKVTGARPESKN